VTEERRIPCLGRASFINGRVVRSGRRLWGLDPARPFTLRLRCVLPDFVCHCYDVRGACSAARCVMKASATPPWTKVVLHRTPTAFLGTQFALSGAFVEECSRWVTYVGLAMSESLPLCPRIGDVHQKDRQVRKVPRADLTIGNASRRSRSLVQRRRHELETRSRVSDDRRRAHEQSTDRARMSMVSSIISSASEVRTMQEVVELLSS
jgi:hypothetical protein